MRIETENHAPVGRDSDNGEQMLTQLIEHLRVDTHRISRPKAQALIATAVAMAIELRAAARQRETAPGAAVASLAASRN